NNAGTAINTPPAATSLVASNSIAADSSTPIAAATRSNVRVVAYPIGAWLSIWLRSLLLLTSTEVRSLFFEADADVLHGSPCVMCWLTRSVVSPLPEHSALHPTTAALAPALHHSAPMRNCVAAWAHRNLSLHNPDTLSCISPPCPSAPALRGRFLSAAPRRSGSPPPGTAA